MSKGKTSIKKDNSYKFGRTQSHKQKAKERRERAFAKQKAKREGFANKREFERSKRFPNAAKQK